MVYVKIWIFVIAATLVSSKQMYHGDKVLRVKVQTDEQVTIIQNIDKIVKLDFWYPDSGRQVTPQMTIDFHVSAIHSEFIQLFLQKNTMEYEILFDNLQEGIEKQMDNRTLQTTKKHQYGVYNDWETIEGWSYEMETKYPKLVSRFAIGKTGEGRPMYVLKIGNPNAKSKAIFMDCGIHAREWISPAFCQWFVKELTKQHSKDNKIRQLLNKLTFYILPVLNIDGYVFSWTEDRMWRKNRSPEPGGNCFGTDLNRNFNISWCEEGSSDDPCTEIYCGPAPESEIETKNVANFIRQNIDSIKAYISIHSYSQMLLYPFSYTYDPAPNEVELDLISEAAVSELRTLYGTNYEYGPSATTLYATSGSSDDWAYIQGVKYSFTFELRDEGKYGFLLPESKIKPTCKETTLAVMYIANYVVDHS